MITCKVNDPETLILQFHHSFNVLGTFLGPNMGPICHKGAKNREVNTSEAFWGDIVSDLGKHTICSRQFGYK